MTRTCQNICRSNQSCRSVNTVSHLSRIRLVAWPGEWIENEISSSGCQGMRFKQSMQCCLDAFVLRIVFPPYRSAVTYSTNKLKRMQDERFVRRLGRMSDSTGISGCWIILICKVKFSYLCKYLIYLMHQTCLPRKYTIPGCNWTIFLYYTYIIR